MDEDDFRALIVVLEEQFRNIGVPDLADESHYVEHDLDSGESRLLPPLERLCMMLEAFDRFLAIQDRATYVDAMRRLRAQLEGEAPAHAVVLSIGEDEDSRIVSDLEGAPNLAEVRASVAMLIQRLRIRDIEPPPTLRA